MKKYPHYFLNLNWIYTSKSPCYCVARGEEDCNSCRGLPKGRRRNSTSIRELYREVPDEKELLARVHRSFVTQIKKYNAVVGSLTYTITRKEDSSWCLSWFEHWTFDEGQTDDEVLMSFSVFVDEQMQRGREDKHDEGYYLMGAEDRYRWHGTSSGSPDERTAAPCRCKYCKEQKKIRIAH